MIRVKNIFSLFIFLSISFSVETAADRQLNKIDVINHLGEKISRDIQVTTDQGQEIFLGDILDKGIPVLLLMAYYNCPMLCSLVLNGLSKGLTESGLVPNKDYLVLTVSIDPKEKTSLAKEKKNNYMQTYFNDVDDNFWIFSTSTQENIDNLSRELGFIYSYDENIKEYAHPAVVYVLTDEGVISNQLFGVNPTSNDLKLSILNAQDNKVASIFDRILLYCYRYDPTAGSYTIVASNVMKAAGASTVFLMGVILSFFWIKERAA